jgi:hypothetical protein
LGKQTQLLAKNDAIVELEFLLSDPEKLIQVSRIRLEQEEKMRIAKVHFLFISFPDCPCRPISKI